MQHATAELINSSMQTVGSSLRQQQQPLSRLIELCRIAGNSIGSDDIAGLVKLNPGPDQRHLTLPIGCNTGASNFWPLTLQLHAQTLLVRTFASTAEFSGGTFNVSSSASESTDSGQRDQDVDDKELLLESALQYVVSQEDHQTGVLQDQARQDVNSWQASHCFSSRLLICRQRKAGQMLP